MKQKQRKSRWAAVPSSCKPVGDPISSASQVEVIFSTALLSYSSYTIQFTHLKYTIQWFLVHSQKRANIIMVNFGTFSSLQYSPCSTTFSYHLSSHCPLPAVKGYHWFTLYLYRFSYSGLLYNRIINLWLLVTGFHLACFSDLFTL